MPRDGKVWKTSDYFTVIYDCAVALIQSGDAHVDSLSPEKMRIYRGTLTEMGQDNPYRTRTIQENTQLFLDMRMGKYPDGTHVSIGMLFGCCIMLLDLQFGRSTQKLQLHNDIA